MTAWLKIDDDELAMFGERNWEFEFPNGTYNLTASETEQNYVFMEFQGKKERWPINLKQQSGSIFKLSGFAYCAPGILTDICWFELHVAPSPLIKYWGDRIVYRTDFAVLRNS